MCGKSPMGGEAVHSIDYEKLYAGLSEQGKASLAKAEARFAEMVERGDIFCAGRFPPIETGNIYYA